MQYKLRDILKSNKRNNIQGILIPNEIAQFFSGCYFKIEKVRMGNRYGIFLESGAVVVPSKKDLENYGYEDCKI